MFNAALPEWISAISQILFLLVFLALILGLNQRLQVYLWSRDIKAKLVILEAMASDARRKTVDFMLKHGSKNPESVIDKLANFFVIEPVSIEPTDIIRRLDHLVSLRNKRFRAEFEKSMDGTDPVVRSKAESAAEITAALVFIYKLVRHLLLLGEKSRNWILIMQLQLLMPQITRIAESYRKALDDFIKGVPIGDAAGPMVAVKLAGFKQEWRLVDEDTVSTEVDIDDRRVVIVKAKGPGSTVGRPGRATERIIESLVKRGMKPSLLITIDAALKLEGEESGSVAEGVGAAIGDIGPEKIRFERIAAKYDIPLRAVVIKMSMEEAIQSMTKKIYEGVEKAVERVRSLILNETRPGDVVVVVGIGNSIGVGP